MDYYDYDGFRPYVSVAARRAQAARELAKLQKKGRTISPVAIEGRKIARTFWGEAWCDNLERYSDYANRLPRGRTYLRNGSVVDLQVGSGRVTALVSGSTMYEVNVTVGPVPRARWNAICADCSGAIDSLVELLRGRFSKGVMTRLCERKTGLFPSPKDIVFTCSCPDWASMCKHVAAVLYGIGARLDHQPQLLFTLRNVDQQDLIANAGSDLSKKGKRPASAKVLASDDLSEMFGIEMAPAIPPKRAASGQVASKRSTPVHADGSSRPASVARPAIPKEPALERRKKTQRLTPAKRRAISERMRQYWAARRDMVKKKKVSQSS
ncbi:MAG: SWIM zinc finger family protein [Vicinamibacterales bacterium]